jgi:TolB protein
VVAIVGVLALVGAVVAFVATRGGSGSGPTTTSPSSSAEVAKLGNDTIVFSSDRSGDLELWTLDVGTGETSQLTNIPGFDGVASISPDRQHVAFRHDTDKGHELWVIDADGSGERTVATGIASDARPSWSPDGTKLAVPTGADATADISIVAADGSGSPTVLVQDDDNDSDPDWSPDGRRIAYTRNKQIWVVAANGSSPPELFIDDNNATDPAWSPDGTLVAYVGDRNAEPRLRTRKADGSDRKDLPHQSGTNDADPMWSPDGTRIVFAQYSFVGQTQLSQLYLLDLASSSVKQLTTGGFNGWPSWG